MKKGDNPCGDCGTKENPIWFTDNVLWNSVMRDEQPKRGSEVKKGEIVCIVCFIKRAEEIYDCAWRLIPEFEWKKN